MASSKTKLRLFVDTKAGKVPCAEADKNFIDFLIYLLSLPIAAAVRILKEKNMHMAGGGSLGHLYESLEKLPNSFLQPNQDKSSLLNPRAPVYATRIPLTLSDYNFNAQKSYKCSGCYDRMAEVPNLTCSKCKGLATYIVMDNLEFMPLSTKMFVSLLKKSGVKDLDAVDEIEVDLGVEEDLKLLKLSLESKTILISFYFGDRSGHGFLDVKSMDSYLEFFGYLIKISTIINLA
ncbi:hypothetical protein ACOSQ4_032965 [Xanthoceras sorbifolium]